MYFHPPLNYLLVVVTLVWMVVVVKPAATVVLPVEKPVHVRDMSPSRSPVKTTIHIRFLTRPFTIVQLRELLSKHGELSDDPDKFWINKVKSHCFATVSNIPASCLNIVCVSLNGSLPIKAVE